MEESLDASLVDAPRVTGHDNAVVGVGRVYGREPVLVYDRHRIVSNLVAAGMSERAAEVYFEEEIAGAWAGPRTPVYLETQEKKSG
jgi:hypothetical protein